MLNGKNFLETGVRSEQNANINTIHELNFSTFTGILMWYEIIASVYDFVQDIFFC